MNNRLQALQEKLIQEGLDGILITSTYNRRYLSGFTGTAGHLLITKNNASLITDFRYTEQAAEQAPSYNVIQCKGSIVEESANQIRTMGIGRIGFETQFVSHALFEEFIQLCPKSEWVGIKGMVETLRMIKEEEEIQIIREACEIADKAFEHILSFIRPGIREKDVALELEFFMRKLGADSTSFDTIVASGTRSALPHGVASEKKIEAGDFVTLDFGAYYKGYVSDITRTVAVGQPSDKLKEIYEIVLKAQMAGVAQLKPGLTCKEADAITRDIIREAGYGDYFGHSTGHGIGLEVHEGPGLSSKSDIVLKPGMVVTVEPGIYISQVGGVRIEDDVVITENGCQRLTHSKKDLIIIT